MIQMSKWYRNHFTSSKCFAFGAFLFSGHWRDGPGDVGSLHIHGRRLPADLPQQFAGGRRQSSVFFPWTLCEDTSVHSEQETVRQLPLSPINLNTPLMSGKIEMKTCPDEDVNFVLMVAPEDTSWCPSQNGLLFCAVNTPEKVRATCTQAGLSGALTSDFSLSFALTLL